LYDLSNESTIISTATVRRSVTQLATVVELLTFVVRLTIFPVLCSWLQLILNLGDHCSGPVLLGPKVV